MTPASLAQQAAADNFGEAVRETIRAQIRNPHPVYEERMQGDAAKAAAAIERYGKGQVKRPERVSSTDTAGGSGGGGGSDQGSTSMGGSPITTAARQRAGGTSSEGIGFVIPQDASPSPILVPVAGGAIDPKTGKFYPSAGPAGVIDPQTGQFIPRVP
jgi:hypothetical protein